MNFHIPWLRFEGIGWKWLLSYIFQVVTTSSVIILLSAYFPLTLVLMSQVCLMVDEAILLVEKFNKSLVDFSIEESRSNENEATTSGAVRKVVYLKGIRNAKVKELTKGIAAMVCRANEWRQEIQDLMQLSFLVEFLLLSLSFSLCCFTVFENGSDFVLLGLCVLLLQLFLYCWAGTRVDLRVDKLAVALYDIEGLEINVPRRKDLQLNLTWPKA